MTGPKHLWSGDWQSESTDPSPEPPRAPRPAAEPHPHSVRMHRPDTARARRPDPVAVRRPDRRPWRSLLPVAIILLVVGVALAEILPGGGSGHHRTTVPSASAFPNPGGPGSSTTPATTPGNTISGRTVNWLGMQIATESDGAVIQTVQLGSAADAAGLDPGDIIQVVNRHSITAAGQIQGAVRDLKAGDAVPIAVDRGSTVFSTVAAFAGHPTVSP